MMRVHPPGFRFSPRFVVAIFTAMIAAGTAAPTLSPAEAADPSQVVIGSVGEVEVRLDEVQEHLETLDEAERETLQRDPAAYGRFVRALLVQRLVLREALAAEWEKSAVVAERMSRLREGVVANTWLESQGAPPEGYPSETDLVAAYTANRESFLQPKSWRLAQIFVAAPRPSAGETPAAKAGASGGPLTETRAETQNESQAETKVKRLAAALRQDPASFGPLASEESEEPISAAVEGEIGWLSENRIHPAIRSVLPEMKLGEVSPPVRMEDGWHFVRVLDIREAHIPTLEQIRDPLAEQLRAEYARSRTETYLSGLLKDHPIAVNEMALPGLLNGPRESPAPSSP